MNEDDFKNTIDRFSKGLEELIRQQEQSNKQQEKIIKKLDNILLLWGIIHTGFEKSTQYLLEIGKALFNTGIKDKNDRIRNNNVRKKVIKMRVND